MLNSWFLTYHGHSCRIQKEPIRRVGCKKNSINNLTESFFYFAAIYIQLNFELYYFIICTCVLCGYVVFSNNEHISSTEIFWKLNSVSSLKTRFLIYCLRFPRFFFFFLFSFYISQQEVCHYSFNNSVLHSQLYKTNFPTYCRWFLELFSKLALSSSLLIFSFVYIFCTVWCPSPSSFDPCILGTCDPQCPMEKRI